MVEGVVDVVGDRDSDLGWGRCFAVGGRVVGGPVGTAGVGGERCWRIGCMVDLEGFVGLVGRFEVVGADLDLGVVGRS